MKELVLKNFKTCFNSKRFGVYSSKITGFNTLCLSSSAIFGG